jgi:hypothetical protein
MLLDMRAVYKKVGGKRKLTEMMKDDKQFQFMVKELMKIETALLSAKLKAQSNKDGNVNGFFVIIRGLEDDAAAIGRVASQREGATIDLEQISHVTDPERQGAYEAVEKAVPVEGPKQYG